jgi:hypothetical protein
MHSFSSRMNSYAIGEQRNTFHFLYDMVGLFPYIEVFPMAIIASDASDASNVQPRE